MKIRTRLNLWYSLVLCGVAGVVIGVSTYSRTGRRTTRHQHARHQSGETDATEQ